MNTVISNKIGETLLLTLYMRSLESKKPRGIIKDPIAEELVNKIDYNFGKFKKAIVSQTAVIIRAHYFDTVLTNFIEQKEKPVIVMIGCGLDGRYQRIGKTAEKAKFYQLDIPEVIGIRKKYIPENPNETYIPASMLEEEWMNQIKEENPDSNFLFIAEGIFMYFTKEEVQTVFQRLASGFANSEMLFDVINVDMSENTQNHDSVKHTRANFIYGTNDDYEMENWANNLSLKSIKYYTDFRRWKQGGIKCWIMSLIPKLKKGGRMLHYKIH